jgi:hypothetical protein
MLQLEKHSNHSSSQEDLTKLHSHESTSKGHEQDFIRMRENEIHESTSKGSEHRINDFLQFQAESRPKEYEHRTDATTSWHNYSEQKLKDLHNAYPQNMKKGDLWSTLHNEGIQKLDSAAHERRLDAMAYKATDWFMNHAASFEKDPQKAKLVADQIRNSFHMKDKATALLLLEATEMQKKYDQQSKFQKYRRVFAAKLLGNELQNKKQELINLFDVHSERFVRIQQKVAQLGRDSRYYKEHKSELQRLRKELSQKEINEQKIAKITEEKMEQFESFNDFYRYVEQRVSAGDLSDEERKDLKLRLQIHTGRVLSTGLTELNAEQKISKEATTSSVEQLKQAITQEQEKTTLGVLAGVGIHGGEAIITTAAFALSIMAVKAASHGVVGA